MKQEQQKQESLTPQKIVQATIDEVYRIAIEKENYDKEAILMSYAEFGCTPAYWQKQGQWEARKQIEAYLKSAPDQPVKTLQDEQHDTGNCVKCGGRTALMIGYWHYEQDDEPYFSDIEEKAITEGGDAWVGGFKCDTCGHIQGLWQE